MVLSIKANGKDSIEKDMEFKFGLMGPSTLDSGKTIWPMVKVPSIMLMVIFTTVNGNWIKPTDKDHTFISMVQNMKVRGKMIVCMFIYRFVFAELENRLSRLL